MPVTTIKCMCGNKLELHSSWANECKCGNEYNGFGQKLASRAQWGYETGEEGDFGGYEEDY